ncbi:flagellar hook-associated protein 1 FlgK [Oceanobacillus limi]|uniref:Flagellar hook-associated protein 1 n=1 Tax=Oceanobacillus limi TaxID=930131 RepID=A0A1I0BSW5_9BACI|nr:flagellar hook-associated protein FlgK [Oceanobacillus limi]SET09480.1 flagellar hook-associated protein 1 FlgK [Oceanobacillus limi]
MSTFNGLEMAKRALFTQQSAIYTTGHNISNANTEGYTRQRVNFETTSAFPTGSRNRPEIPGQMGTGVKAGSVERIRDQFLDAQYRAENSKQGYWDTMSGAISRMEEVMNEPSESGLDNTMDKFWQSLQDLSVNPEDSGARSVVVQRGIAVSDTFNYLSDSLNTMKSDLESEINVTIEDANSIVRKINSINNQIKEVEPHGYQANDLYDERDRLIDELSGIVNVKVHRVESSDSAPDNAAGLSKIELVGDDGQSISKPPIYLVNPEADQQTQEIHLGESGSVDDLMVGDKEIPAISQSNGSLHALINAHGYEGQSENQLSFTRMLNDLDTMAKAFAEEFNKVHSEGYGLGDTTDNNFFGPEDSDALNAGSINVLQSIIDDPDLVAASSKEGAAGNGENALNLAAVSDSEIKNDEGEFVLGEKTSVTSFYESLIGSLGVTAQEANRMSENTNTLRTQVEENRQSVSSVSLDEEMSNMIKFQHAYNAAARSMTTVDEMIDRIINNMGLVGR